MAEESHSTWVGLTCTYSDEVGRVVDGLYQADLIVPFDWAHWWEGRRRYGDNSAAVEKAPVADAVRMITVVVRQDRFVEGGLGAAIENGVLPAALRRLRRWYDER